MEGAGPGRAAHRRGARPTLRRLLHRAVAVAAALAALLAMSSCMAVPDALPGPSGTAATSVVSTPDGLTLAPGSMQRALQVDGRIRMYRVYRPAGIVAAAPLVVMLHGGLGSAWAAERAYGWNTVADREKIVVLYPDAVEQAWNAGGGCCGLAASEGVDDVRFLDRAIDDVRSLVPVDPKRIYTTGMSAGGMMAYRLACETDLLAAIGPVAATMLGDCPNPAPMSVIAINGTADPTVPYGGAPPLGLLSIDSRPVPEVVASWRTTARCGGEIVSVSGSVTTSVAQCPSDRTVTFVTIEGGGHDWPGVGRSGPLDAHPTATGPPPTTSSPEAGVVNATAMVWEFFQAHHR